MRLASLRNYMFMLLCLTADRSLKLTIRGMPQENLNNVILFPAFYPQYKFPYCTSKILNFHLKEVFLCFQIQLVFDTYVEQTACGGESTFGVCDFFFLLK